MSPLPPGRARMERHYRMAVILGVLVAAPLFAATTVLQVIFNAPYLLVLVLSVVGLALEVVALILIIPAIRKLPW